jgi:hypothetical protein
VGQMQPVPMCLVRDRGSAARRHDEYGGSSSRGSGARPRGRWRRARQAERVRRVGSLVPSENNDQVFQTNNVATLRRI